MKVKQTTTKKPRTQRANFQPKITDLFTQIVQAQAKCECVKEYKFHQQRKWRFDYAIPAYKIAIEIDGGVWTYGRHNRAAGYLADMEKFNEAAALGWVVLKFTPEQQYRGKALQLIRATIQTRSNDQQQEQPQGQTTQSE